MLLTGLLISVVTMFHMVKNFIIVILIIIVMLQGYWIYQMHYQKPPAVPSKLTAGPPVLTKGMTLTESPLAKSAYKAYPGTMSAETKKALSNFNITMQKSVKGAEIVLFTAKGSPNIGQAYIVEAGNFLYFIDQTPADDKTATADANLRDDYGVIVDKNGVVQ